MQQITVRNYRPQDRQRVRDIAWDTAMMGEPASAFFDAKEAFTDFLTIYFTDYEPESALVVASDSGVVGYLLGARDSAAISRVFTKKIFLPLLLRAAAKGVFFNKKNLVFICACLMAALRGEFKAPDFSRDYPATLHINLEEAARRQGAGSQLVSLFCDYLMRSGVRGVSLATMSERGAAFFAKQGFDLLYKGRRSYFRHVLHRDVPIYIYGKKLA